MSGPSPRDFFTNWRESKLPLPQKIAVALRNNWKKAVTFKDCCGNHGEPGC